MPVKPEPPDVLYVTETDGHLTATPMPPVVPYSTSQPASLPPPPSLMPRPQMPGLMHAPMRPTMGAIPRPPPIRMPPAVSAVGMPLAVGMQPGTVNPAVPPVGQIPNGQPIPQINQGGVMPAVAPISQVHPMTNPLPSAQVPMSQNIMVPKATSSPLTSQPKVTPQIDDKNAPDSASRKGTFGWTTIAKENLPILFRRGEKFVAVRMVENKLLSHFPNMFPEELKERPPLHSYYATEHEVKLLNEINCEHCDYEYGHEPFTVKDLVVQLSEFERFYEAVVKSFPHNFLESIDFNPSRIIRGGWVQINNTVVPYLYRGKHRYVPLKVIKFAASLDISPHIEGYEATKEESDYLNFICSGAGISFDFDTTTKIVSVDLVRMMCQPVINELPSKNPFENAKFVEVPEPIPHQPPLHGMSNMMNSLPYGRAPPNMSATDVPMGYPPPMTNAPSAATSTAPSVSVSCGSAPVMPGSQMMHSHPCPRHPGSYMFGSNTSNMYFPPGNRFTGPISPNTLANSMKYSPELSNQGSIHSQVPPSSSSSFMPPPYMYPGHMMPRMPYGPPPPYPENHPAYLNADQEIATSMSKKRRRRSSEKSRSSVGSLPPSRGSTPVPFATGRRTSGDLPSPTVLSRPSSRDPSPGVSGSPSNPYVARSPRNESPPGTSATHMSESQPIHGQVTNSLTGPARTLPILNVPNVSRGQQQSFSQATPTTTPVFGSGSQQQTYSQASPATSSVNVSRASRQVFQHPIYFPDTFPTPPASVSPSVSTSSSAILPAIGRPENIGGNVAVMKANSNQGSADPSPNASTSRSSNSPKLAVHFEKHFGVTLLTVKEKSCSLALLEDVAHQLFPLLPLTKFMYAIKEVLKVPIKYGGFEMEKSFRSKMGVIQTTVLEKFLPQLRYMFKENMNPLVIDYLKEIGPPQPSEDSSSETSTCVDGVKPAVKRKSVNSEDPVVIESDDEVMAEESVSHEDASASKLRSEHQNKSSVFHNASFVMDVEEDPFLYQKKSDTDCTVMVSKNNRSNILGQKTSGQILKSYYQDPRRNWISQRIVPQASKKPVVYASKSSIDEAIDSVLSDINNSENMNETCDSGKNEKVPAECEKPDLASKENIAVDSKKDPVLLVDINKKPPLTMDLCFDLAEDSKNESVLGVGSKADPVVLVDGHEDRAVTEDSNIGPAMCIGTKEDPVDSNKNQQMTVNSNKNLAMTVDSNKDPAITVDSNKDLAITVDSNKDLAFGEGSNHQNFMLVDSNKDLAMTVGSNNDIPGNVDANKDDAETEDSKMDHIVTGGLKNDAEQTVDSDKDPTAAVYSNKDTAGTEFSNKDPGATLDSNKDTTATVDSNKDPTMTVKTDNVRRCSNGDDLASFSGVNNVHEMNVPSCNLVLISPTPMLNLLSAMEETTIDTGGPIILNTMSLAGRIDKFKSIKKSAKKALNDIQKKVDSSKESSATEVGQSKLNEDGVTSKDGANCDADVKSRIENSGTECESTEGESGAPENVAVEITPSNKAIGISDEETNSPEVAVSETPELEGQTEQTLPSFSTPVAERMDACSVQVTSQTVGTESVIESTTEVDNLVALTGQELSSVSNTECLPNQTKSKEISEVSTPEVSVCTSRTVQAECASVDSVTLECEKEMQVGNSEQNIKDMEKITEFGPTELSVCTSPPVQSENAPIDSVTLETLENEEEKPVGNSEQTFEVMEETVVPEIIECRTLSSDVNTESSMSASLTREDNAAKVCDSATVSTNQAIVKDESVPETDQELPITHSEPMEVQSVENLVPKVCLNVQKEVSVPRNESPINNVEPIIDLSDGFSQNLSVASDDAQDQNVQTSPVHCDLTSNTLPSLNNPEVFMVESSTDSLISDVSKNSPSEMCNRIKSPEGVSTSEGSEFKGVGDVSSSGVSESISEGMGCCVSEQIHISETTEVTDSIKEIMQYCHSRAETISVDCEKVTETAGCLQEDNESGLRIIGAVSLAVTDKVCGDDCVETKNETPTESGPRKEFPVVDSSDVITILNSSSEDDAKHEDSVIILSDDDSPDSSKAGDSASAIRQNEDESFLKIVSVVGGSEILNSSETSCSSPQPRNVVSDQSPEPTIVSIGKSKIIIAPSSSQRFRVTLNDKDSSLKRPLDQVLELQPSKRIKIQVENNNDLVRQSSADQSVIVKEKQRDGTVKEVVCID